MKNDAAQPNECGSADRKFPRVTSIGKALRLWAVLASVLLWANAGGLAAAEVPFFLEDFEDGNATDGNPVTWVPGVPFASGSSGSVIDGSYVLTTVAEGMQSKVWAEEFDSVGDVSIRAQVRGQSPNLWVLSVFSHAQLDGRCHWAVLFQGQIHLGSSWNHASNVIAAVALPAGVDPWTDDVHFQFDAVGTNLSATVWQPGSPKPSSPQLTATAPSLPPGRVGFETWAPQMTVGSFEAMRIGDSLPASGLDPIISLQPRDQTVLAGEDALFRVLAYGTDPLSYQWWKDETALEGATDASLALTDAQFSMAGLYSVVVSNVFGAVTSAPARLTLVNPPQPGAYSLVYSLDIPNNANYLASAPAYIVDHHLAVSSFTRVAYYLKLERPGGLVEFIWAEMDPFTADAGKIGIPTVGSGAVFQQHRGHHGHGK